MKISENINKPNILEQFDDAKKKNIHCIVDAVILNNNNMAFTFKRSASKKLFPNCWDLPGGHIDNNEDIFSALYREVEEETGWEILEINNLIDIFDWEDNGTKYREFDFIVTAKGDLNNPILEKDKVSGFKWILPSEIEILKENREQGDYAIYNIVKKAFEIWKNNV